MIALVVLRNGLARMIGTSSSSSPMSKTMKSTGTGYLSVFPPEIGLIGPPSAIAYM